MEDLKNSYLNEQGLRQERDDLRIENARLRDDVWRLGGTVASYGAALELARREDIRLVAENKQLREALTDARVILDSVRMIALPVGAYAARTLPVVDAALEMSGGVK